VIELLLVDIGVRARNIKNKEKITLELLKKYNLPPTSRQIMACSNSHRTDIGI